MHYIGLCIGQTFFGVRSVAKPSKQVTNDFLMHGSAELKLTFTGDDRLRVPTCLRMAVLEQRGGCHAGTSSTTKIRRRALRYELRVLSEIEFRVLATFYSDFWQFEKRNPTRFSSRLVFFHYF